jgi:hypothetical protein
MGYITLWFRSNLYLFDKTSNTMNKNIDSLLDVRENADIHVNTGETITFYCFIDKI